MLATLLHVVVAGFFNVQSFEWAVFVAKQCCNMCMLCVFLNLRGRVRGMMLWRAIWPMTLSVLTKWLTHSSHVQQHLKLTGRIDFEEHSAKNG